MPQLLIRDVPEALVLALDERAAANGLSAEAEHRLILEEALRRVVTSSASVPRACAPGPPAGHRANQPTSSARITTPDDEIVVDASIALKWVLEGPGSDAAEELLEKDLAAPSLGLIEAGKHPRSHTDNKALAKPSKGRGRRAFSLEIVTTQLPPSSPPGYATDGAGRLPSSWPSPDARPSRGRSRGCRRGWRRA